MSSSSQRWLLYTSRSGSKDGTYSFLDSTANLNYTDSKANAGTTYYYKVKALATDGTDSSLSAADVYKRQDRGQPGENGLASLHTLTAAVKAEHASAGDRAVKGVGVNGHMEIRTEGIGFLALVLHGGHVPHLHGHAAALQGDAAAIRNLAALDGLVGIAVGIRCV